MLVNRCGGTCTFSNPIEAMYALKYNVKRCLMFSGLFICICFTHSVHFHDFILIFLSDEFSYEDSFSDDFLDKFMGFWKAWNELSGIFMPSLPGTASRFTWY